VFFAEPEDEHPGAAPEYFSTHSAVMPITRVKSCYHYIHTKRGVVHQGSVPCFCEDCRAGRSIACTFRPLALRGSVEHTIRYSEEFLQSVRLVQSVWRRRRGLVHAPAPDLFDYKSARAASRWAFVTALTVADLKAQLRVRRKPLSGNKGELRANLCLAIGVAYGPEAKVRVIALPSKSRRAQVN